MSAAPHLKATPKPGAEPGIRPLVESDLGALVTLHREAFADSPAIPDAALGAHLRDLFFAHPWRGWESPLPSLACEDEEGRLVGCLGVMPRPMTLDGEPLVAVVSHNFMVTPSHRSSTTALRLLRALFAGPQDLSLAEGNDASRRLWQALGGETPTSYTLRWTQPLRPARYGLSRLARARGRGGRWAAAALRPLAALADGVAARLPGSPFRRPRQGEGAGTGASSAATLPLEAAAHAAAIERAAGRRALRPIWEPETVARAVEILTDSPGRGALHGAVLRSDGDRGGAGGANGDLLGCYLYELKPDGTAAVVQLAAAPKAAHAVLDHLAADARRRGAAAVVGQVDPALLPVLSERPCIFHRGPTTPWLVVHSRRPEVLQAFHRGDAFFTHLEGEWWV